MIDPNPIPPASTGTWGESIETRLSFVESVIRAGHSVGQQPGTAPVYPAPNPPLASARDAALTPSIAPAPEPLHPVSK